MDIGFLIILALGIFFGFFIQTVIGFAGALIALPILLININLQDAIAYISVFYLYSSILLISKEWKNIDGRIIFKLMITTVIGVILGIWVLEYSRPTFLKRVLGVFIQLYVIYSVFIKDKTSSHSKLEFIFGLAGGFFSGLFSSGGPLYVLVVKNATSDMNIFRATMFGVLGLVTITRVPILFIEGILNVEHLYYSLFIIPFFLSATLLGKRMYTKLNESFLKKAVLILLFLSGIVLSIKG